MNPNFKPYLLRAFYEWVSNEGWTPHISVSVDSHTLVPQAYVKEGQIVLNISPNACRNFFIHDDGISFDARFNGAVHSIWVPIGRISSIFAKESEEGMTFEITETPAATADKKDEPAPATASKPNKRPTLKVVK